MEQLSHRGWHWVEHLRHCLGDGYPCKQQTMLSGVRRSLCPEPGEAKEWKQALPFPGCFFPSPLSAQFRLSSPGAVTGQAHVQTEEMGWGLSWWDHPWGTHLSLTRVWNSLSHLFLSLFWWFLVVMNTKSPGRRLEQERRRVINLTRRGNQLTYVKMGTGKGSFYLVLQRWWFYLKIARSCFSLVEIRSW